jgi:hypothetical protein
MGGITGAASFYLYQNHVASRNTRSGSQPSSQGITGVLGNYLSLDAKQKEELNTIIGRSRERYRVLSQQFRPQYDAVRNETRQEIRRILRPDQEAKFDEFLRDMDQRHRAQQNPRY